MSGNNFPGNSLDAKILNYCHYSNYFHSNEINAIAQLSNIERPILQITTSTLSSKVLIDTGAGVSCMSLRLFEKIDKKDVTAKLLISQKAQPQSKIKLKFEIYNRSLNELL